MSLLSAQKFAALLDSNNYDEASKMMAEDCEYHYWEGSYRGQDNIISIYRQHHIESKKLFDEITYTSQVEEMPNGNLKISLLDKIRKGGRWHELRSYQIITFQDNLIVHIEHCEIPGEMESFRMFYRS